MTLDKFNATCSLGDRLEIQMVAVCSLVTEKQGYVLVTATTRGVTGVANYWNTQSVTAGTTLGFTLDRTCKLIPSCEQSNKIAGIKETFIPVGVYLNGTSRNLNVNSINAGSVSYHRMPIRINLTHRIINT